MPKQSNLERAFLTYLKQAQLSGMDIPDPEPEYLFNTPHSKHAIDFAWPKERIAVECEGGVFTNGRHTRGAGYTEDCRKYNLLTLQGWRLLRYTRQMLDSDPFGVMRDIQKLLEGWE